VALVADVDAAQVGNAVFPVGADVRTADVETASDAAPAKKPTVVATVAAVPPGIAVPVEAASVRDGVLTSAFEGAVETVPSPNAITATSAMRLKVVFVDICFLSIVDLENLPSSA
jgi:hypothetical protein